MSYSRKHGSGNLLRDEFNPRRVCDRLMDAISDKSGVLVECKIVHLPGSIGREHGRLTIVAKDYADFIIARKIAIDEFQFDSNNIAFVKHRRDESGTQESRKAVAV